MCVWKKISMGVWDFSHLLQYSPSRVCGKNEVVYQRLLQSESFHLHAFSQQILCIHVLG